MRPHSLSAFGVTVAALAIGATFAPMANASGHSATTAHQTPSGQLQHHAGTAASCYAQRDNDNGVGIVSQNFESTFDQYDSQGADDFKLKKACKVKTVSVDGIYFNGSGPADSFNVIFYKDAGGTPGAVFKSCMNASYTETGFGSPIIKCKTKLKITHGIVKGKYWLDVQSNMDFAGPGIDSGEWGWNTNNTVRGVASQWQNPGDGFATGCTTYTTTTTCIPSGEGGDFSFSIN